MKMPTECEWVFSLSPLSPISLSLHPSPIAPHMWAGRCGWVWRTSPLLFQLSENVVRRSEKLAECKRFSPLGHRKSVWHLPIFLFFAALLRFCFISHPSAAMDVGLWKGVFWGGDHSRLVMLILLKCPCQRLCKSFTWSRQVS